MNTRIEFRVISNNSPEYFREVIYDAYAQFDHVVNHFSRFDKESELSKLNASSGKWFKCSQELFRLVSFSLDIAKQTNGQFDPTIIDILEAYGYDHKDTFKNVDLYRNKIPNTPYSILENLLDNRPGYSEIELKSNTKSVKLMPSQRIDLGAIGKGYAIDLAYKILESKFDNFMINAGGDIRVKGLNDKGEKWKVKLEYHDGDTSNYLGYIELSQGSICCSGGFARKIGSFHHLINPQSGKPEDQTLVSYVLASDAITADTFSTVSYLIGKDVGNLSEEYGLEYFILNKDKSEVVSQGFPIQKL